jgi:serine/threonine-protein kinase
MGIVYKAHQKRLDRFAAIKVIQAGTAATRQDMELFFAEARTAARVRHPNVVGVYEAGQCFGWHFIAMEFIDGVSLAGRLAEGRLPCDEAARLAAKIARAVDHLHRAGILHCDLKPANILLDRHGTPYVADLGLSRILAGTQNVLEEGAIAGTPHYMSPEQASGRLEHTGPATDVYSLGATLYHMLTCRPPFSADEISDVLDLVVGRAPPPPRSLRGDIPRPLETICLTCLEKAPGDRYGSAGAVARA